MKVNRPWICPALLWLVLAGSGQADDIDIYLNSGGTRPARTRIMLALDFHAGSSGAMCRDVVAAQCQSSLGDKLYAAMDLYGLGYDAQGRQLVERGADGALDLQQSDPANPGKTMAQNYWPGTAAHWPDVLRAALRVVLGETAARIRASKSHPGVEVGLMVAHEQDCDGAGPALLPDYARNDIAACSRGAYVLQGFVDISEPARLDTLLEKVAAVPEQGMQSPWMRDNWTGHPYSIRDFYLEFFRYITGQAVFNGFLGGSDYGSRMAGNLYHDNNSKPGNDVLLVRPDGTANLPLLAQDTGIMLPASLDLNDNWLGQARYISPLQPREDCTRLFMLNALFGPPGSTHPDTDAALTAPYAAGGLLPGQRLDGEAGDVATVAALNRMDFGSGQFPGMPDIKGLQNVTSYFMVEQASQHSSAMAAAGGSRRALLVQDPRALLERLEAVFNEILAVSSTLVAASVPMDGANRARGASDVFFALFRPDSKPRWPGNIKKLKIVELQAPDPNTGLLVAQELIVQAPLGDPPSKALSDVDGRILPDALTFWTDPGGADVQAYDAARGEFPGTDGRTVDRGGAGQQISGFLADGVGAANHEMGARQLFTEDPATPGTLLALDADLAQWPGISAYLDPQDRLQEDRERALIRWIRGQDAFDADGDGTTTESRRWLLGDALHSRPLVVNYGVRPGTAYSLQNPDIRLFFGGNDGVFHVLQNTEGGAVDAESGRETWAFLPLELLAMQSALAQNAAVAVQPHPYGMDGEAVAYLDDRDGDGNIEALDGDKVWVFIGQRRGGRGLYAFDMTNPDAPAFKWKITHRTPGFQQLAMTFSTPQIARLDFAGGVPQPVLVFAGGYNGGWQGAARVGKDAGAASDSIGNAIYVVDAASGELIWKAVGPGAGPDPENSAQLYFARDMTDSIPSALALIDADRNGLVDRAYVGDSGGTLWRVELTEYDRREPGSGATDAGNWYVRRVASLGGAGAADRRFFHAPDYVRTRDSRGDYDGLVITSGNRAAPLDESVQDFAYLIKDRAILPAGEADDAPAPPLITQADLADITQLCVVGEEADCAAADLVHGWKLQLQARGEKGLSSPLVNNGVVLFTSYLPQVEPGPDACAPSEGASRVYALRLGSGAAALQLAGSLSPLDPQQRYTAIGPGLQGDVVPYRDKVLIPGQGIQGQQLITVPGRTRWRVYWREDEVDVP